MEAITSNAVARVQKLIHPHVDITGLRVQGKWLVATLSSGVHFWTLNK